MKLNILTILIVLFTNSIFSASTATIIITAVVKEAFSFSLGTPIQKNEINLGAKNSLINIGDVKQGDFISKEVDIFLKTNSNKTMKISLSGKNSGALESKNSKIDMIYSLANGADIKIGGEGVILNQSINRGTDPINKFIIKSKDKLAFNQKTGNYKATLNLTLSTI